MTLGEPRRLEKDFFNRCRMLASRFQLVESSHTFVENWIKPWLDFGGISLSWRVQARSIIGFGQDQMLYRPEALERDFPTVHIDRKYIVGDFRLATNKRLLRKVAKREEGVI
jgi:hypothetical protein